MYSVYKSLEREAYLLNGFNDILHVYYMLLLKKNEIEIIDV